MAAPPSKVNASKETLDKVNLMKKKVESAVAKRMKDVTQRRLRTLQMQHKLKQNQSMDDQKKNEMMNAYYSEENKLLREERKKLGLSDFIMIKTIGKGAFGEVRIVRNKNDNTVYAMKTMRKKDMIAKNQVAHVKAERDLMANSAHMDDNFLVRLHFSFQDATYLYLVMEFCGGGDLMTILMREDILSENQTKFYIAELAQAINAVHELDFVHRDLKPDNILIANDGHIKLSDFGLAKSFNTENDQVISKYQTMKKSLKEEPKGPAKEETPASSKAKRKGHRDRKLMYSTVGTPDYIAPEVFSQKGYDKMVDWWSMGVIMFECLVGYPPFYAEDPLQTCRKIVHYRKYFKIPYDAKLSKECADLVHNLVCSYRRRYSFAQIKSHAFFKQVPWNKLKAGMKPPFIPNLASEVDASNFEQIDAEMDMEAEKAKQKQKGAQSGTVSAKKDENKFMYYTFKPSDFSGVQSIMNAVDGKGDAQAKMGANAKYASKKPLPANPKKPKIQYK